MVILRGLKDVSWAGAKATMTDGRFLQSILDFDKDGLKDKQAKQVKEYMKDPKFTVEAVKGISTAGVGLLKWVMAMMNYYNVARTVNPKRQKVADSEKQLRMATKELAQIKEQVASLNEQLATLNSLFAEKTGE